MGSEVGREVRRLREERGWGQAKLAVEAGMAVSGVSQIENGKRNPNSATLTKLARALGVEVGDLFPKAEAAEVPLWSDEAPERLPFNFREAREFLELYCERWEQRLVDGAVDERAIEEFILTSHGWIPVLDVALTAEVNELPVVGDDSDILRRAEIGRANERYMALFDKILKLYVTSLDSGKPLDGDTVVRIDEARKRRERLERVQHRAVG